MPIFSSNRVSGVGNTIVAAECYTERDFGRILSECAINDMRLFNAAIARDFQEAQAMNEGTMVASEIQALQEFSVKEAWKGLKEKLKKLWTKIKGAFKTVYAKLSLWLNRNTKAYIAQHRKELLAKSCGECKIPKFRKPKHDISYDLNNILKAGTAGLPNVDHKALGDLLKGTDLDKIKTSANMGYRDLSKVNSGARKDGAQYKADGIYSSDFAKIASYVKDITIPTADALFDSAMKNLFEEPNENLRFKEVYGGRVDKLFENLSGASKYLKDLRKANKDLDGIFKGLIKKLDKAESDAKSDAEGKAYKAASGIVSKCQGLINAMSAATIKVVKKSIANDRGLVAALVAYNPKAQQESALLEFAFMAGYDALHEETEGEDIEAAAEEEGIEINIEISGGDDVDVNVEDNTDE